MGPSPGTLDRWRRAEEALLKLDAIRSKGVTAASYVADTDLRDIVERNFQVAIEAAIDLANELIAARRWRTPTSAREAFEVLAENKAIDAAAAVSLGTWAGFRNVLDHSYAAVRPERVVQFLNGELGELRQRFLELSLASGLSSGAAPSP